MRVLIFNEDMIVCVCTFVLTDVARFPDCHEDGPGITSERCSFSDEHQINPANSTKSAEQFSEE